MKNLSTQIVTRAEQARVCHRWLFLLFMLLALIYFAALMKFYISNRRRFSKLFVLLTQITHVCLMAIPPPQFSVHL